MSSDVSLSLKTERKRLKHTDTMWFSSCFVDHSQWRRRERESRPFFSALIVADMTTEVVQVQSLFLLALFFPFFVCVCASVP